MRISWRGICVGLVSVCETMLASIDTSNFAAGNKKPSGLAGRCSGGLAI